MMPPVAAIRDIPGFLEAVREERFLRDRAFVVEADCINGFPVRAMTLRHYTKLRIAGSPFLPPFQTPAPEELFQFLWCLHPEFTIHDSPVKQRFMQSCLRFVQPKRPLVRTSRAMRRWNQHCDAAVICFAKTIHETRQFVERMMQDRPAAAGGEEIDYFSDACAICARLGREYHHFGSEAEILDLPLPKLFQYLREARAHDSRALGRKPVLSNPSDDKIAEYLETLNRKN